MHLEVWPSQLWADSLYVEPRFPRFPCPSTGFSKQTGNRNYPWGISRLCSCFFFFYSFISDTSTFLIRSPLSLFGHTVFFFLSLSAPQCLQICTNSMRRGYRVPLPTFQKNRQRREENIMWTDKGRQTNVWYIQKHLEPKKKFNTLMLS